jgi:hypothetical protein
MTVSDFGLVSMEFKPCKSEFEHVCSVRVEDNRWGVRTQKGFNSAPFHARMVFVWQWHVVTVGCRVWVGVELGVVSSTGV